MVNALLDYSSRQDKRSASVNMLSWGSKGIAIPFALGEPARLENPPLTTGRGHGASSVAGTCCGLKNEFHDVFEIVV